MSLTVRPLLVTDTAVHEDEHIVCHPSFVFLYFSFSLYFFMLYIEDFFLKFPLLWSPPQFDVFHMAESSCLTRTYKTDEGDTQYRVTACTCHVCEYV